MGGDSNPQYHNNDNFNFNNESKIKVDGHNVIQYIKFEKESSEQTYTKQDQTDVKSFNVHTKLLFKVLFLCLTRLAGKRKVLHSN